MVFVVDSADPSRMREARDELSCVIRDPLMLHIPVLILANKQDMDHAKSVPFIKHEMGLEDLLEDNPWHIQSCCGLTGEGIVEGMQEFARMLKEHKKKKSK